MKTLFVKVIVLYFATVSGDELFLRKLPPELQKLNTPEGLGRHLHQQLLKNETRFLISKQCYEHVLEYVASLFRFEFWALQMYDSSSKIPSGLLEGNLGGLGAFDQCIKIKSKNKEKFGVIKGKYCLGEIQLINMDNFKSRRSKTSIESAGQQRWINFAEGLIILPWGICLPEACSAKDFQFLHFLFFLRFREETCQTLENQTKEFDNADIGAISFFGVIGALMVISTIYDIILYYNGKKKGSVLLRSFSVVTNLSKITTIKRKKNEIGCLYGVRIINLLIIIIGARFAGYLLGPNQNWIYIASWWWDAANYLEILILIDTAFVVSGMLISYNYLKAISEGHRFNLIFYYINRIVRLTPGLVAIVLIHTTLLRHMGSGPIWTKMREQFLVDNCRENWWASLLYIQNYVNPQVTRICVLQTWQLSVDMQLFLLSPLILLPLIKFPRFTFIAIGFILVCSIVSSFLACWVYDLKSVIKTSSSLEDIRKYAEHFFFPTHTKASSWIIGFIVGYFVFEAQRRKFKIRKGHLALMATFAWALCFGLIAVCFLVGRELIGKEYNWLLHALHMAFIRPLWAAAVGWIIFACANGYGGLTNSFLSFSFFRVLSRISYGTYLVFMTVMFILTFQTRENLVFGNIEGFYRFFGDCIFCFGVGLLWTLAFEYPFVTIVKTIFGRSKKSDEGQTGGEKSQ